MQDLKKEQVYLIDLKDDYADFYENKKPQLWKGYFFVNREGNLLPRRFLLVSVNAVFLRWGSDNPYRPLGDHTYDCEVFKGLVFKWDQFIQYSRFINRLHTNEFCYIVEKNDKVSECLRQDGFRFIHMPYISMPKDYTINNMEVCMNLKSVFDATPAKLPALTADEFLNLYTKRDDEYAKFRENLIIPEPSDKFILDETGKVLIGVNGLLEEVAVIPETVKQIDRLAFKNQNKLKTLILPRYLSLIGSNAFEDCTNLNYLIVRSQVTKVEDSAFHKVPVKCIFFTGCEEQWLEIVREYNERLNKGVQKNNECLRRADGALVFYNCPYDEEKILWSKFR